MTTAYGRTRSWYNGQPGGEWINELNSAFHSSNCRESDIFFVEAAVASKRRGWAGVHAGEH